ncbi:alpha/beta fold hydrolase [Massilia sp. TSP1-1-2]|uniref:S9 family peptidase n=1 Tax=Massilia sp. TSP1-1-2 TaxID=2804649 RepID=UPI003CFA526C
MITLRSIPVHAVLATLLFVSHLCSAQTPVRPPIGSFFKSAAFSGAEMSPNGRFVAFRVATKGSRATLGVLDLDTMQPTAVAAIDGVDIGAFHWVNDKRLVFSVTDLRIAEGERDFVPGLFAVDRDGNGFRRLVETDFHYLKNTDEPNILPWNTFLVGVPGTQESNDVFVMLYEGYGKNVDAFLRLQRVNTKSGLSTFVDTPDYAHDWLFGPDATVRTVVTSIGKRRAVHYNDPASATWRKLAEFDSLSGDAFKPIWYGADHTLYVSALNGHDKSAIYRYDLSSGKLAPQPLVSSNDYDIDASFIHDKGKLLGVRYHADGEITQWFDPAMLAIQKEIDTLLPATSNRISVGQRSQTANVLIDAYSDVQPHSYLIYNRDSKKLTKLGMAHPDIDPKQMGTKDMVRYKARDGLDIPAYITMPPGGIKKNLPMVVMVHGGPNVRGGRWEWDRETQFLASRGYVVLEPEFRGSTGFGSRHFKSGWKQWGLAMQDDLADGAKWAIANGIADPKRICIAGASYGGYASMMGLVKDPALFKCGINWVGVTDINLLYTVRWSDLSDTTKKYGMPMTIGDPVADAAQFAATSPLAQASRIRQPVLLAYGGVDERVPLVHGKKFYDAVRQGNPNVEWVVYGDEGHGWSKPENNVDFWSRVEKFLDRNIGKP